MFNWLRDFLVGGLCSGAHCPLCGRQYVIDEIDWGGATVHCPEKDDEAHVKWGELSRRTVAERDRIEAEWKAARENHRAAFVKYETESQQLRHRHMGEVDRLRLLVRTGKHA